MQFIEDLKKNLPKDPSEDKFHQALLDLTSFQKFNAWDGAVTIGIFPTGEVVFIRRSFEMKSHPGQIAFVGGSRENSDSTPIDNALREYEEETGFPKETLDVLGITPPVVAGSGLRVIAVPCVIKISKEEFAKNVVSNGEWDLMFQSSWSHFEDLNSWVIANRFGAHTNGKLLYRPIMDAEWQTVKDYEKTSNTKSLHFWGASARMLWNLMKLSGVELNHS